MTWCDPSAVEPAILTREWLDCVIAENWVSRDVETPEGPGGSAVTGCEQTSQRNPARAIQDHPEPEQSGDKDSGPSTSYGGVNLE